VQVNYLLISCAHNAIYCVTYTKISFWHILSSNLHKKRLCLQWTLPCLDSSKSSSSCSHQRPHQQSFHGVAAEA